MSRSPADFPPGLLAAGSLRSLMVSPMSALEIIPRGDPFQVFVDTTAGF
jgi:hypothetical protein